MLDRTFISHIHFELRGNELVIKPEPPMSAYRGMLKRYKLDPADLAIPKEQNREILRTLSLLRAGSSTCPTRREPSCSLQRFEQREHLLVPVIALYEVHRVPRRKIPTERPKAGRSRPPPVGIKQSGKAAFA